MLFYQRDIYQKRIGALGTYLKRSQGASSISHDEVGELRTYLKRGWRGSNISHEEVGEFQTYIYIKSGWRGSNISQKIFFEDPEGRLPSRVSQKNTFFVYNSVGRITGAYG